MSRLRIKPIYAGKVLKNKSGKLMFEINEVNSSNADEARLYLGRYINLPDQLLKGHNSVQEGDLLWIYQSGVEFDTISFPHDLKRKPGDECLISGFTLKDGYSYLGLVSGGRHNHTGLLKVGTQYNLVKLRSKNNEVENSSNMNNFQFSTLDGILTSDSDKERQFAEEMTAYYEDYLAALREKISSVENEITGVQNDIRSTILELLPDGGENLPSHYDFQKVANYLYDDLYPLLGRLEERLNALIKLELAAIADIRRRGFYSNKTKNSASVETRHKLEALLQAFDL